MKIEAHTGCTNFSTLIDGKDSQDCTLQELRDVALQVLDTLDMQEAQRVYVEIIRDAVESFGEMESFGYCDQCGDYPRVSTMTIE